MNIKFLLQKIMSFFMCEWVYISYSENNDSGHPDEFFASNCNNVINRGYAETFLKRGERFCCHCKKPIFLHYPDSLTFNDLFRIKGIILILSILFSILGGFFIFLSLPSIVLTVLGYVFSYIILFCLCMFLSCYLLCFLIFNSGFSKLTNINKRIAEEKKRIMDKEILEKEEREKNKAEEDNQELDELKEEG